MAPEEELYAAALAARARAYSPHSNFAVGCAIRSASGAIHVGANVENQSYPEGWCAETSAIAQMIMAGEREILEVCVVADLDPPITPCGGCRQRLAEFAGPSTLVHAGDLGGPRASWTMAELLPAVFRLEEG
ncbi:cytidine deaminase [Oceanicella actignis]|uniref:cytidine deaminase n=1 Tax=Oceanicella actignis TaxID=1189325 RepID=UPI0011E886CB|nr:cytidine deaminase [Oceanicella actignis]TYO91264.1 cytidine deaminase [Oceanicella actignis]